MTQPIVELADLSFDGFIKDAIEQARGDVANGVTEVHLPPGVMQRLRRRWTAVKFTLDGVPVHQRR